MERVAFLIEATNQRIGCLLNPNSLVLRRTAGLRPRQSAGGQLSGAGLTDDPLLYTGGGRTELELELLFDVSLAGSSATGEDVRELTRPLWELAENRRDVADRAGYRQPPTVRFVWGKSWNIPGVIAAVAERLEHFTPAGEPRRSWMRMRMVRINEPPPASGDDDLIAPLSPEAFAEWAAGDLPEIGINYHEVIGGGAEMSAGVEGEASSGFTERLEDIAARYFGSAAFWRWIALCNGIEDPLRLRSGMTLRIVPFRRLRR
jgi:hypothetical protein